jgi:hypothetical protein
MASVTMEATSEPGPFSLKLRAGDNAGSAAMVGESSDSPRSRG